MVSAKPSEAVIDWLLAMRLRQNRITLLFDGFLRQLNSIGIPVESTTRTTAVTAASSVRDRPDLWTMDEGWRDLPDLSTPQGAA